MTLHVLAGGELFQHVLNAIATVMKEDNFMALLRLTALMGIILISIQWFKQRDPLVFATWFIRYVLCFNVILIPKTTVLIDDISSQTPRLVQQVPTVFALTASLITTLGYALAQTYDELLSMPDDLLYTKTGALFGSRLIQASTDFRIIDPELNEAMNHYLRSCVVGDIRINHKYSVGDLETSNHLWDLISTHASPLRMTSVNGQLVSCQEAASPTGEHSLKKKLMAEIKKAYRFFGINLFGKPKQTTYEQLFQTHLTSAFQYYQGLTDDASNVFLQMMMINAIREGITHYQTVTDSAAGVINQTFSQSQAQHRWSWEIAGIKALWFLPMLHTWLTLLLFGVFPLIMVLSTLPLGNRLLMSYGQFFLSLQCWPIFFAIVNAGMTLYGTTQTNEYGQFNLVNINKLDELHQELSGVAGYIMLLIPFLANGLVSNLSAAFNGLSTSMTSHVQGSTMSVANESASAHFGLGQTSFYTSTANTFSANKHDSNWSHLHGLHTEQAETGVLKTLTAQGQAIFDTTPGMTRSAISLHSANSLSDSLNQAYEKSVQTAQTESQHEQTALSHFAHSAIQLTKLSSHDKRLGEGIAEHDSAHYNQALSTLTHIASDVSKRLGISQEDALSHLASVGGHTQAGFRSDRSVLGRIANKISGFNANIDAHGRNDASSTHGDRYHETRDTVISAREAQDFNQALSTVQSFSHTHQLDNHYSQGASLSNQLGNDLREAQTASHNRDVSLSASQRIQSAKSYVTSHSDQVTIDLNQAFPAFVAEKVGEAKRDELFSNPGNLNALNQLQALGDEFIQTRRDALINEGSNLTPLNHTDHNHNGNHSDNSAHINHMSNHHHKSNIDHINNTSNQSNTHHSNHHSYQTDLRSIQASYKQQANHLMNQEKEMGSRYQTDSQWLSKINVGIPADKESTLQASLPHSLETLKQDIADRGLILQTQEHDQKAEQEHVLQQGKATAQKGLISDLIDKLKPNPKKGE